MFSLSVVLSFSLHFLILRTLFSSICDLKMQNLRYAWLKETGLLFNTMNANPKTGQALG